MVPTNPQHTQSNTPFPPNVPCPPTKRRRRGGSGCRMRPLVRFDCTTAVGMSHKSNLWAVCSQSSPTCILLSWIWSRLAALGIHRERHYMPIEGVRCTSSSSTFIFMRRARYGLYLSKWRGGGLWVLPSVVGSRRACCVSVCVCLRYQCPGSCVPDAM